MNVSSSYSSPGFAQPVAGTAEGCLGIGVISCNTGKISSFSQTIVIFDLWLTILNNL